MILLSEGWSLLGPQEGSEHQGEESGILSSAAFGGLQGVDLLSRFSRGFRLYVSGQIAVAEFPLLSRIGAGDAKSAAGEIFGSIATVALFTNRQTAAPGKGTAFGAHESAGRPGL